MRDRWRWRRMEGSRASRSCRARLCDRDRMSRSCGRDTKGTQKGQHGDTTQGQRHAVSRAGRGHRRGHPEGCAGGGGGWRGVGDTVGTSAPLAGSPHLLEALHVLEVESDVEKAQVGIDELELAVTGGGTSVTSVSPQRGLRPSASLRDISSPSCHLCSCQDPSGPLCPSPRATGTPPVPPVPSVPSAGAARTSPVPPAPLCP